MTEPRDQTGEGDDDARREAKRKKHPPSSLPPPLERNKTNREREGGKREGRRNIFRACAMDFVMRASQRCARAFARRESPMNIEDVIDEARARLALRARSLFGSARTKREPRGTTREPGARSGARFILLNPNRPRRTPSSSVSPKRDARPSLAGRASAASRAVRSKGLKTLNYFYSPFEIYAGDVRATSGGTAGGRRGASFPNVTAHEYA